METEIPFQSIQEFWMTWEINEHAKLKIKGVLRSDNERENLYQNYSGLDIRILIQGIGTNERKTVLFCGETNTVDIVYSHGMIYIELIVNSASIKLDSEMICCSFQDSSQTYSEVVKEIGESGNARIICTVDKEKINKPVICYKETRWEFMKRMASCQNQYIIPDVITGRRNLWFGMRNGQRIADKIENCNSEVEIKKSYESGEKGIGAKYYYIKNRKNYSIGDWAELDGRKCVIYKKEAHFVQGELLFGYKLTEEQNIRVETYYNESFTGLGLEGTIQGTKKETVRIRFDMDGKDGAYDYPWRPETGNAMYAMPELGAKAVVYFMNHDEGQGIGIRCLNSSEDSDGNPEQKKNETIHGGAIQLLNEDLEVVKEENSLTVTDHSGIDIAGEEIEIEAKRSVKISAKRIRLSSASEIKAVTDM